MIAAERMASVLIEKYKAKEVYLTTGVEWSYRLRRSLAPDDYKLFEEEYQRLLEDYSLPVTEDFLREYWREWRGKNSNR